MCADHQEAFLPNGGTKGGTALSSPSFPTSFGSSSLINSRSEGSLTAGIYACRCTSFVYNTRNNNRLILCDVGQTISINMLHDDVLLTIFDFCVDHDATDDLLLHYLFAKSTESTQAWQSLVHVCRRWRRIVFGFPRRLNLRLICTPGTLARGALDVWPALPLLIRAQDSVDLTKGVDNIVAVLERSDRVNEIHLSVVKSSPLEKVLAAMQEPLRELTHLVFHSYDETVMGLPDSFLGGSAPRLRLWLRRLPFPGLPKLLLSATHLVSLRLDDIPHSGYLSPEVTLNALSTLTSLRSLTLQFQSPRSRPDRASRLPPPPTRTVLPALVYFWFEGVSEYLDDLVSRIDAPRLEYLSITFFNQILFDTPQVIQFIIHIPMLKTPKKACVAFGDGAARVNISSRTFPNKEIDVKIPCLELDWQVSSLKQVFTSCLPPLSTLENLYIFQALHSHPHWKDNLENTLWLELMHPFSSVKNLYLSEEFAPRIGSALQELIEERTTEVLPSLQDIFLEGHQQLGPVQKGIRQFVTARQVTNHPIVVSRWDNPRRDKILIGRD